MLWYSLFCSCLTHRKKTFSILHALHIYFLLFIYIYMFISLVHTHCTNNLAFDQPISNPLLPISLSLMLLSVNVSILFHSPSSARLVILSLLVSAPGVINCFFFLYFYSLLATCHLTLAQPHLLTLFFLVSMLVQPHPSLIKLINLYLSRILSSKIKLTYVF